MEENRVTETGQLKLEITVKKILRVLSIMITIFCWFPVRDKKWKSVHGQ